GTVQDAGVLRARLPHDVVDVAGEAPAAPTIPPRVAHVAIAAEPRLLCRRGREAADLAVAEEGRVRTIGEVEALGIVGVGGAVIQERIARRIISRRTSAAEIILELAE